MTRTQFENSKSLWTLVDQTFSIEITTLQGNGLYQNGQVTGPTGKTVPFTQFKPVTDTEGELTHWVYRCRDYTYMIFND